MKYLSEEVLEIFLDFCNALEAAVVNVKRQISQLTGVKIGVQEETFKQLKWDTSTGARIGDFEVAFKAKNISENFKRAYNILHRNNATISNRYFGEGYDHSYWLYEPKDRIYRQKLKR